MLKNEIYATLTSIDFFNNPLESYLTVVLSQAIPELCEGRVSIEIEGYSSERDSKGDKYFTSIYTMFESEIKSMIFTKIELYNEYPEIKPDWVETDWDDDRDAVQINIYVVKDNEKERKCYFTSDLEFVVII